jgi:hypothetical protein
MTDAPSFATSQGEFAELAIAASAGVDPSRRLPDWPFRASTGFTTVYEYDVVLGGSFGRVLEALASAHDDAWVCVVALDPEMPYYSDGYSLLPAFKVSAPSIADNYSAAMQHEPGGDVTGALNISLNVVAMAGSTGTWAVWAQRDWEIGLLLTPEPHGPWLSTGIPWFGRDVELSDIRSPEGWGMPLSDDDLMTFRRNLQERGTGDRRGRRQT